MLVFSDAIALVDMPKNMQFGRYVFHKFDQFFTPHMLTGVDRVALAEGWGVCDQNIGVMRNQPPFFRQCFTAWQVEGPIHKPGLPRTAVECLAVDLDGAIAQVR